MAEIRHCLSCGAKIRPASPTDLCPRCLLEAGLASEPQQGPGLQATEAAESGGFVPPTVTELQAKFPQFELLELLGKGGMGAVYKARQPGLDRLVAVKILPPEVGRDAAFAERFTREARAMAQLSHSNIVGVYDFGQADGLYYFVMEFVDGVNLRQAIRGGAMSPQEALAIVPQICEALQFAHDEGIVHRDIKPENILIDKKGRVKIADFGLAKLLGHEPTEHRLTATHQLMGTLRYMAPEQLEGSHSVDHRADIYSLGVVFYELLTGELPIGRFAPPSKKVQIDVRLDEVVLRALEKEPELRYQHASELKTSVEAISDAKAAAPAVQSTGSPKRVELGPRFWAKVVPLQIFAWLMIPLLWNAREIGLLIAGLVVGGVNVLTAQWIENLVATVAQSQTHNPGIRWPRALFGVLLTLASVYFLFLSAYQTCDRMNWNIGAKSQDKFRQEYQGAEHRLLQRLTRFQQNPPRAELQVYQWTNPVQAMNVSSDASPMIGNFQLPVIGFWCFIGTDLLWCAYVALFSRWRGSPGIALVLTVGNLVIGVLTFGLVCAGLPLHGSTGETWPGKYVTTNEDVRTVLARVEAWANTQQFASEREYSWFVKSLPQQATLAQIEGRHLWRASVFDRWHFTWAGLRRAAADVVLEVIGDANGRQTVIQLYVGIPTIDGVTNKIVQSQIDSLEAAIKDKTPLPGTKPFSVTAAYSEGSTSEHLKLSPVFLHVTPEQAGLAMATVQAFGQPPQPAIVILFKHSKFFKDSSTFPQKVWTKGNEGGIQQTFEVDGRTVDASYAVKANPDRKVLDETLRYECKDVAKLPAMGIVNAVGSSTGIKPLVMIDLTVVPEQIQILRLKHAAELAKIESADQLRDLAPAILKSLEVDPDVARFLGIDAPGQ